MNIFKRARKLAKKMTYCDFALLKGSVFFFTLFLLGVWPQFNNWAMSIHWGAWLAAGVILAIPLWKKMLS